MRSAHDFLLETTSICAPFTSFPELQFCCNCLLCIYHVVLDNLSLSLPLHDLILHGSWSLRPVPLSSELGFHPQPPRGVNMTVGLSLPWTWSQGICFLVTIGYHRKLLPRNQGDDIRSYDSSCFRQVEETLSQSLPLFTP